MRLLSSPTSLRGSLMTTGPNLLFSGASVRRETFTTVDSSILPAVHWKTQTLTFWELVNLTLHNQQYFYQETISRKVTNQGSRSQSDYEGRIPPPYSNPLFQYHGIFIIIIYYCNFVLFCFFIISFLFDLLFWFYTTLFIFIPFFLFFFWLFVLLNIC